MISGSSRWVRPCAVVAIVALVAVGCGSKKNASDASGGSDQTIPSMTIAPSGTPQPGGTMTFGTEAEDSGWNPTVDRWDASGTEIAVSVMDPLVAFDANLAPQP